VIQPSRRRVFVGVAPVVALAIYLYASAIIDFAHGVSSLGTAVLLLGGGVSQLVAWRIISARIVIDIETGVIRVEGLLTGFALKVAPDIEVIVDRRAFGLDGLTLVTADARRKIPLIFTSLDRAEFNRIYTLLEEELRSLR
jgi:hypothetical protein